jgi:hypothetical protein
VHYEVSIPEQKQLRDKAAEERASQQKKHDGCKATFEEEKRLDAETRGRAEKTAR